MPEGKITTMLSGRELSGYSFYRGRVALYAVLRALGVARGDEVILQAYTCLAVPQAIVACGATPVFADIEPDGYNVDPRSVRERCSDRTKAIVVQHTFGIPADLTELMGFAASRGIPVVEDCCHTYLSSHHGRQVGSFGAAAFYSFEWGKPLVLGLGGALRLNDTALATALDAVVDAHFREPGLIRQLRLQSQYIGYRIVYRPTTYWRVRALFRLLARLGAAEGNSLGMLQSADFALKMAPASRRKLVRTFHLVEQIANHSRHVVAQYRDVLSSSSAMQPVTPAHDEAVYVRYPLRVSNKTEILERARAMNTELADWYLTPVHPVGEEGWPVINFDPVSCPNAMRRTTETVSLPVNAAVGSKFVHAVARVFQ